MNIEDVLKFIIKNKYAIVLGVVGVVLINTGLFYIIFKVLFVVMLLMLGVYVDKNVDKIKELIKKVRKEK